MSDNNFSIDKKDIPQLLSDFRKRAEEDSASEVQLAKIIGVEVNSVRRYMDPEKAPQRLNQRSKNGIAEYLGLHISASYKQLYDLISTLSSGKVIAVPDISSLKGEYRCCRVNGKFNEVLVTKFEITNDEVTNVPIFTHTENREDEETGQQAKHEGIITRGSNGTYDFLSLDDNLRILKTKHITNHKGFTLFYGITSSIYTTTFIFSAKTLLIKIIDNENNKIPSLGTHSLSNGIDDWISEYLSKENLNGTLGVEKVQN